MSNDVDRLGGRIGDSKRRAVLAMAALSMIACLVPPAPAADAATNEARTFVVATDADDGPGSLRWAILDANEHPNGAEPDRIAFAIPGDGPHTIRLASPLPEIGEAVVLDGYTQPGARPNTLARGIDAILAIEVDGSGAGAGTGDGADRRRGHGLVVRGGGTTIRGLALRGFAGDAIRIVGAGGSRVEGNRLGAEPLDDPSAPPANAGSGIAIVDSRGNVVGGLDPAARNAIAGNGGHAILVTFTDAEPVASPEGAGNAFLGNRIAGNRADGIALDRRPGGARTPEPRLASAFRVDAAGTAREAAAPPGAGPDGTLVEGTLEARPLTAYRVELFATPTREPLADWLRDRAPGAGRRPGAGPREGDTLVLAATVTTDAAGRVELRLLVPDGAVPSRALLTATATDAAGHTSEFSAPIDAPLVTKSWTNAAGGNWSVAGNWNPAGAPAATDDAVITLAGTYTVTFDTNATVASLTLGAASGTQTLSIATNTLTLSGASTVGANGTLSQSGGVITGTGALTLNGPYNWSGGTQSGATTTTVNGMLTLGGGTNKDLTSSRTLTTSASAAVTWNGTGAVRFGTGAVINNAGTWDLQTDSNLQNPFGGAATFNNSGTFRKSAGVGISIVFNATTFNNTGAVVAQTGTISLRAPGTHGGTFNGAGGTVEFSTSTHDLNAGTAFLGTVTLVSGALNVNSALTAPTFTQSAGSLQGTASFTTTGLYTWTGGTMSGAGTTNVNGGLLLSGGNTDLTTGRILNVPAAATVTWSGTGAVRFGTGAVINNAGTWDCQTDLNLQNPFGGAATFNNSGTFRKTAGTGSTIVFNSLTGFHNTGTVRAQTGTISLRAVGTHTGAFNGAGGTVEFALSTHDLNAGTSLAGTITLVSGALNVNSPLTAPAFTHSGGTLQGTASFTTTGLYTWTGGTMSAAGTTIVNGGLLLSGGNTDLTAGRILNVPAAATVTWSGTGAVRFGTGAVINNAGTWDCQNDLNLQNPFGGAATFNNSGTFRKTAGTGSTIVFNSLTGFHNTGTVRAQTGTISLRAPGTHTGAFNGAGGTVEFALSAHDLNAGTSLAGAITLVSGALNVNAPLTAPSFNQSGGSLQGTASFTTTGVYTWTAGTMTQAGTTIVNGGLQLTGATVDLTGGRILNIPAAATATMAASAVLRFGTGAVINNNGTWDWQNDTNLQNPFGGTAVFNNAGAFRKTAGTGISVVFNGITGFHNTGTVAAQTGTLSLRAPGTHTGTFNGTGGTIEFSTSTHDLNAGTAFVGTITLVSGALNVNAPLTAPSLTQSGGTLQGAASFTTTGPYTWTAGTMTQAGTTNANGGLQMSGGTVDLTGGRILNIPAAATATMAGSAVLRFGTGAVINNSGTFDWQIDTNLQNPFGGTAVFNNSGTFRKSAGAGLAVVFNGITGFHNTGTVAAQAGTLSLRAPGTHAGAFHSSGGTVEFSTSTHDLNAGTSFAGTVTFVSGVLNVNAPLTAPSFTQSGGTLQGPATFTIAGLFTWTGGAMTGAATTNANGGIAFSGAVTRDVTGGRTLNTAGTTTWAGAGRVRVGTGASIVNAGTWDCQGDSNFENPFGGASSFTNLAGATFRKSVGPATTTSFIPFTNGGAVEALAGTLTFSGTPTGYTQNGGSLTLNGGNVSSPNTMNITAGTVTGIGTVSAGMNNAGRVAPGLVLGILNETGNYAQGAGGTLDVDIGGTNPGATYDQFKVGGTGLATLAGTLRVNLVNGYAPAGGETFTVMTYASRTGTFTSTLPDGVNCVGWTTRYDPAAVVVTAVPLPAEVGGQVIGPDKQTISWVPAPAYPGTTYDVLRGRIPGLPVGSQPANETCLATGLAAPQATDATKPAAANAFWYLVRERVAGCGVGTYGRTSANVERLSATCP